LKDLLVKHKGVIQFVGLFLGTYLVLSFCYSLYLDFSKEGNYHPDFVTHLVAKQSASIISGFGYEADIVPHNLHPQMQLFINRKYLGNIIEGCNSLSVIILFVAFIVAFAEKFKKTAVFILAGAVLIYTVNLIRIVILSIALHHYPEQEKLLHGVVFPAMIYGMVFLLWMLWVKNLTPKTIELDA
jgi:exosortase family protein XrtF